MVATSTTSPPRRSTRRTTLPPPTPTTTKTKDTKLKTTKPVPSLPTHSSTSTTARNTPMRRAEKLLNQSSPLKLKLGTGKSQTKRRKVIEEIEEGNESGRVEHNENRPVLSKSNRTKSKLREETTTTGEVSPTVEEGDRPRRTTRPPERFVPGTRYKKKKSQPQPKPTSKKPTPPVMKEKTTTTSLPPTKRSGRPPTTTTILPPTKKSGRPPTATTTTTTNSNKRKRSSMAKKIVTVESSESEEDDEEEEEEEIEFVVDVEDLPSEEDEEEEGGESDGDDEEPTVEVNPDTTEWEKLGGLTEGCFTLTSDSAPSSSSTNTGGLFRSLLSAREPAPLVKLRSEKFQLEWAEVERISQDQLFHTQSHSFDAILKHLHRQFRTYRERTELVATAVSSKPSKGTESPTDRNERRRLINTITGSQSLELVVVRHGSNRSDANPLYDRLCQLLIEPDSRHPHRWDLRVADLQLTTLNPSLDMILRTLFKEWLRPRSSPSSGTRFELELGTQKAFPYDLSIFKDWYQQYKASQPSNPDQEIFVVLLRDYKLLDSKTLQDLIRILSLYRPYLPIWVILGASASPITLESLLPQDSLSMVTIQTFDLVDPHRSLLELVEILFVNRPYGMKLDGRIFQLLFDTFVDHTHSLSTFMASYKYSLMDHFYSNPLSILLSGNSDSPSQTITQLSHDNLITHEHCELIRMQPSFQSFVKDRLDLLKSDISLILEEDTYLIREILPPLLDRIHHYQTCYPIAFRCLLSVQAWVGEQPQATQFIAQPAVSIYTSNLEMNVIRSPFFESLMRHVATSAAQNSTGARHLLDTIDKEIQKMPEPVLGSLAPCPSHWSRRFQSYRRRLEHRSELTPDGITELIQLLKEFFRLFLPSYRSFPLHEPFYYSNLEILEKTFNPQPQAALEYALTRPRVYLPTPASREGGAPPLPDAAIAYRLYKEAGRLINLYDWLKAFEHLVVKQHYRQDARASPPSPIDIQARFAHCLNELKFLGYILPTQRKTDHVQKLTWN